MIQTNRTLLIEEIAPSKDNIISIIQDAEKRESLSDEEINDVHRKLEVSSFEEVIEKFNPEIYMFIDTDRMQVEFYRTIPEEMKGMLQAVPLAENTGFFDELVKLIENKRNHKFVLTSFQDFGSFMFKTPSEDKFRELREKLICELAKGNNGAAEKILEDIITEFDEGIFLVKLFLKEAQEQFEKLATDDGDICFVIPKDNETQVSMIMVSDRFEHNRYHTKVEEDIYSDFLQQQLKGKKLNNSKLLALTLELCCKTRKENLELLVRYYNEYLEYYGKILQKFWWEAKPLLETLLGIRSFFSAYTVEKGDMPPTMIITNCTPELLMNSKYKNVFRVYLETMNEKNYLEKTIWYAIMPRIPFVVNSKEHVRERFVTNGKKHIYKSNELEYVQVVLEILGKYRIQTFLSINPEKDTIFHALERNGVEKFEASFDFLDKEENKEFMIPCYPNFMIIPQEYTLMILGKRIKYDMAEECINVEGNKMLWMGELIIEAAYVAAGLQASCQCPKYLSEFYPQKVLQDIPCVAYRLCENKHNIKTIPQMFPEIMGYSKELYSQINRQSRGMVFAPYKGKIIAITDRVYSYKQGRPDCVAIMQTLVYIERVIRYESQDYKEHLIREFFQARPGSIISSWKDNTDSVNGVLKKEERIEYSINEKDRSCIFKIHFRERNMEDVVKISS